MATFKDLGSNLAQERTATPSTTQQEDSRVETLESTSGRSIADAHITEDPGNLDDSIFSLHSPENVASRAELTYDLGPIEQVKIDAVVGHISLKPTEGNPQFIGELVRDPIRGINHTLIEGTQITGELLIKPDTKILLSFADGSVEGVLAPNTHGKISFQKGAVNIRMDSSDTKLYTQGYKGTLPSNVEVHGLVPFQDHKGTGYWTATAVEDRKTLASVPKQLTIAADSISVYNIAA